MILLVLLSKYGTIIVKLKLFMLSGCFINQIGVLNENNSLCRPSS